MLCSCGFIATVKDEKTIVCNGCGSTITDFFLNGRPATAEQFDTIMTLADREHIQQKLK